MSYLTIVNSVLIPGSMRQTALSGLQGELSWLVLGIAVVVLVALWSFRPRGKQKSFTVTLRKTSDADGSRHLWAALDATGNVVITGRDYGDGVERIMGYREYEWVWTIPATSVPALLEALGAEDDVLAAIGHRFSGEDAAELSDFLETNAIPADRWSRIGD